ncbi:MAG: hypothetical protein IJP48_07410 [Synergistaceae bacterium]|nr:hypothetical protein [Synergistaceae bacterium]
MGGGKVSNIDIATNGSIIPNDSLLDIIKSCNTRIRISDYNVTPDRTKKLINILHEHEIIYSVYEFAGGCGRWYNCGGVDLTNYALTDNETVRQRYDSCAFRRCLTLERGQLARCSRASDASRIQGFNESESDYLKLSDFSDNKELRKALLKYYMFPTFMEACKYCNGTSSDDMIEAAVQL